MFFVLDLSSIILTVVSKVLTFTTIWNYYSRSLHTWAHFRSLCGNILASIDNTLDYRAASRSQVHSLGYMSHCVN